MRSVTSWFNATLFKKNLTRFWPVWAAYLLIWLFLLPINLLLESNAGYESIQRLIHRDVLKSVIDQGLAMAVVFALLSAVAVWSYLYNNRSACLMHTLPIKRRGLFLTNFLSGMTFMAGPNLVVLLLTLLAEAAVGYVEPWNLVVWFISVTLLELFFFCFATFCAMCTGHILGLPALYGIFNALVAGVVALVELTLDQFVYGYAANLTESGLVKFLTPVWLLSDNVEVRWDFVNGEILYDTCWLSGVGFILVYAVVGLILAALAWVLCRRRHMERAGDVITVGWMRPVFQYGVAFCCALAGGVVLFEIFRHEMPDTAWTMLLFLLICGAVGYFIARMLLEKSFRVFRCWKGCLPLLGALIVLVCVMEFDLTGYERRVPDMADIEEVHVSGLQTTPYDEASYPVINSADPEVIEAALAVHQSIVDGKTEYENDTYGGAWETSVAGYEVRTKEYVNFTVIYTLKNGDLLHRDYTVPVYDKDLTTHGTLGQHMDTLVNLPQVVQKGYDLADRSVEDILRMEVSTLYVDREQDSLMRRDVQIDPASYEKVYRAVLQDLTEGNIGRRYLMDNEARLTNCYTNDLTITFLRQETEKDVQERAWYVQENGMVMPAPTDEPTWPGGADVLTTTIDVTLQATARHTLAALDEVGVLSEGVTLLTQAENMILDNAYKYNDHTWEDIELFDIGGELYLGE